jgi:competence protein ComFA
MRFLLQNNILIPSRDPVAKRIDSFSNLLIPPINPSYSFSTELQQALSGKKLLLDELDFSHQLLHEHYLHGYLAYHYGVTKEKRTYMCHRCGNSNQHRFYTYHCARCEQPCTYCRHCIQMGRVSQCTPLLTWTGPPISFPCHAYAFDWVNALSPPQQDASNKLAEAMEAGTSLLIWAVCGAGKTEMLFQGIHTSICNGKRVCIATPRTDVVLELLPRLQRVFPTIPIAALYGGASPQPKNAPLVLSTTHQLLRYEKAFDVVMIDEVDAFPYSMDAMLQRAVAKAVKNETSLIYVTATPSAKWQQEVKRKKRQAVIIPARYHRCPLPEPTFQWCGAYTKRLEKGMLPRPVMDWIYRYLQKKPILLFVPNITLVERVTALLRKENPHIAGVHAEDKDRKEKVQAFRNGDTPLLVTTTILERGVTIEGVQVGVLGAEQDIFTESALVQIAGRAGRSTREPTGDVILFHHGKTTAMLQAKNHIKKMNKQAKERGMIDDATLRPM